MDKNSLQRPIRVGYGQETEMNPDVAPEPTPARRIKQ